MNINIIGKTQGNGKYSLNIAYQHENFTTLLEMHSSENYLVKTTPNIIAAIVFYPTMYICDIIYYNLSQIIPGRLSNPLESCALLSHLDIIQEISTHYTE